MLLNASPRFWKRKGSPQSSDGSRRSLLIYSIFKLLFWSRIFILWLSEGWAVTSSMSVQNVYFLVNKEYNVKTESFPFFKNKFYKKETKRQNFWFGL